MADPERTNDMRRYALDILNDHFLRAEIDGVLDGLGDSERAQYTAFLAESLGDGLLRYLGYWVVYGFPTVEEWRAAA